MVSLCEGGAESFLKVEVFLTLHTLLHPADLDTSPKKRRETPGFYGFVPPTGRGLIFFLMMVNSAAQFLARIVSVALLGAVSKTWAFGYLAGDLVSYLIYTLVRNDFFYFTPIQSYIGSIGLSLLMRTIEKVGRGMRGMVAFQYLSQQLLSNRLFATNHRSSPTSRLCCN